MHPDTEQVLTELRKLPAFRAQELAARHKGFNVDLQVARSLEVINGTLQVLGRAYFMQHRGLDSAPYGVFLLYDTKTCVHEAVVQVGNAAILAMRRVAVAQLMTGNIARVETPVGSVSKRVFEDKKPT